MKSLSRSILRENIFKILFCYNFHLEDKERSFIDLYIEEQFLSELPTENDIKYVVDKTNDILNRIEEIDEIIKNTSKGWAIHRLGKSELSILRLAIYEILFDDDIPEKVAINEAVELAKMYGEDQASSFVNGILAGVK